MPPARLNFIRHSPGLNKLSGVDIVFIKIGSGDVCANLSIGFNYASFGNSAVLSHQCNVDLRVCHAPTNMAVGSCSDMPVEDGTLDNRTTFDDTICEQDRFSN